VSVTDDAGNQANSPFTTLVIASNQPPVAVLTVTVAGKVATLNASGSSDPEHGALSYTYRCGNGAPDIGPTTSSSAQCTYSTSGTYTLRLTVTDAGGLSASTTTKLRI